MESECLLSALAFGWLSRLDRKYFSANNKVPDYEGHSVPENTGRVVVPSTP